MRTAAVLPVKRFAHAKQRLGAGVSDALRLALARTMVADVLTALAGTEAIERSIVVTGEQDVAAAARTQGAIVVDDEADAGQSAAAALGVQRALALGIERVLCIPGDCPALDPGELRALLGEPRRAHGAREVVIVPDRHGSGTNGLLLTPPDAIAPAFGPGSCERHRERARRAGVACRVERPPSLLLDVDTAADLAALQARLVGDRARAPRTRTLLESLHAGDALAVTSG